MFRQHYRYRKPIFVLFPQTEAIHSLYQFSYTFYLYAMIIGILFYRSQRRVIMKTGSLIEFSTFINRFFFCLVISTDMYLSFSFNSASMALSKRLDKIIPISVCLSSPICPQISMLHEILFFCIGTLYH